MALPNGLPGGGFPTTWFSLLILAFGFAFRRFGFVFSWPPLAGYGNTGHAPARQPQ